MILLSGYVTLHSMMTAVIIVTICYHTVWYTTGFTRMKFIAQGLDQGLSLWTKTQDIIHVVLCRNIFWPET